MDGPLLVACRKLNFSFAIDIPYQILFSSHLRVNFETSHITWVSAVLLLPDCSREYYFGMFLAINTNEAYAEKRKLHTDSLSRPFTCPCAQSSIVLIDFYTSSHKLRVLTPPSRSPSMHRALLVELCTMVLFTLMCRLMPICV